MKKHLLYDIMTIKESEITGVMVQYYKVCQRELWFYLNQINMNYDNDDIDIGRLIHENTYKREKKELGISAVRGGTIVGDHDVIFAGKDEVITFSHTAYSKAVFGKGAVFAAKFLKGKENGRYDMADVIAAN